MKDDRYKKLMHLLNNEIVKIKKSGINEELISVDKSFDNITYEDALLIHTKLHLFYQNKNGKKLKINDLYELHNKIITKLKDHKKFDGLDEKSITLH